MNKTLFLLASASLLMVGCASTYQQRDMHAPTAALDSTKRVLVAVPQNGQFGQTVYEESGTMTAEAIVAAFGKHASGADIISGCVGEDCLNVVDDSMCGYLVMPIIRHWEDRATEWSGKSDRVEIQLVIFDATSKEEIANSTYTGKSKWMTFGGDHPQDLLTEPTEDLVSSLYGQGDS
jgi:hypothetical protein